MYDKVFCVALGNIGLDAYLLPIVELYSGFSWKTYEPSGKLVISIALKTDFVL